MDDDLSEDIDVGGEGNTTSAVANNVTVSDEELLVNEDEVMVSELDAPAAEANDTLLEINTEVNAFNGVNDTLLEINAEVNASAEVNAGPTEGNANTEGLSTVNEAFDGVEANHTAEALDSSVLADDISETVDISLAELNITEAATVEDSVNNSSSSSSEQSLLVLDSSSAGDKTLSTTVQKVSEAREVELSRIRRTLFFLHIRICNPGQQILRLVARRFFVNHF